MRNIKKLTKIALVCFMAFTTICSTLTSTVHAATYNLTEEFQADWFFFGSTKWGNGSILYLNGKEAFCLEPDKVAATGSNSTIDPNVIGLTDDDLEKLALITWYGYRSKSNPSRTDYMLTQNLVWKYLGSSQRNGNTQYSNESSMTSWFSNVMNKVNHFDDKPSFHGKTVTVDVGKTTSVTDTNEVLSGLRIKKVTGGKVSISGNTLKITPDGKSEIMTITFDRGMSLEQTQDTFVVRQGNSQAVSYLTGQDPYNARLSIKVNLNGNLKLKKVDEDGKAVPDTSFKISQKSDMTNAQGTYTTGKDGTVTVKNLKPGTYYVQETEVPEHLVLDNTIHKVIVKANETTSCTATNLWKKGKVQLTKSDKESGKSLANAIFAIYDTNGDEVERITTGVDGKAESGYLRFGDYYVQEVIAPEGYLLDDTKYPITITSNEQMLEITATNIRTRGQISLSKEDSVTDKQPQGEATLQGAVYELRAKENIMDPVDSSVIYKKGSVVDVLTTNSDGNTSTDDQLYLGNYELQEVKASEGYTLDPTIYDIALTYDDQKVELVTKSVTSKERVASQAFQIIKISDNFNGEADKLEGVEFTIKAQKDIDKYGSWEAAPIAKNAQGKEAAIMVTDKEGHAISDRLPYGKYVVRETKVPDDHYAVEDFTIEITEDSSEPQAWRILNDEKFRAVVKIVKEDAETGNTIALEGATFKIRDKETGDFIGHWEWTPFPTYVDEWTTGVDGAVMTGDVLDPGIYELVEVKAPDGYLLNTEPVEFRITMNGAYEILPDGETPVITVKMQDTSVKGRIVVEKRGEVFSGIKQDRSIYGNMHFQYEGRALAGAEFEIYAAEDIYAADNSGTILYEKDALVQTLITGETGTIMSTNLPLGKYYVQESKAPEGMVLNKERQEVELTYDDQETAIIYSDALSFYNSRQNVEVEAYKYDAETNEPLADAEIALYANRNLYNTDGELVVKANTKLQTAITDEDGKAIFTDLPLDITPEYAIDPHTEDSAVEDELIDEGFSVVYEDGIRYEGDPNSLYYITEEKAPAGYASGVKIRFLFDAKYTDQEEATQKFTFSFYNEPTQVEISKTDITGEKELPGATLQIINAETEKVVEEFVSKETPTLFKALPIGKYLLVETIAPDGYVTAEPIEFEVTDTGEILKVQMKDEMTHIDIIKIDAETGKLLAGAELQIIDGETEEIVKEFISMEEVQHFDGLPIGKYILKESKAPAGYATAAPLRFTIKDSAEILTVTMENQPQVIATGNSSMVAIFALLLTGSAVTCLILLRKNKETVKH